jgi:RecA-family ATPase
LSLSSTSPTPPATLFVPADAYLELPKAIQPWVIDKLIPAGGMVNLFGKPKTGKSFLALSLAKAICEGQQDWCGYEVLMPGPVAYLQIDTPREEWSARIGRIKLSQSGGSKLWIADMYQVPEFPFNILNPAQTELAWLKQSIAAINPVLTIIDTLREVHGGDENDSTTMRNVIAHLVEACRPSSILLLSHSRKDSMLTVSGDDDMMDQGRGSSYVAGRMDVVMKLTQKRLMFKGRATGQTIESVIQDPATGLVLIAPETEDLQDKLIIDGERLNLGGSPSQNALAAQVAKRLNCSRSGAIRRMHKYFPHLYGPTSAKQKPSAGATN